MKKNFMLLAFVATLGAASAQYYTTTTYLPQDGERQFGLVVTPNFGSQTLGFAHEYPSSSTANILLDGSMSQGIGTEIGLYYGYETDHGGFLDFGAYLLVSYGINPFKGSVNVKDALTGLSQDYDVKYTSKAVMFRVSPFLAHRFGDNFVLDLGFDVAFALSLKGNLNFDGYTTSESSSSSLSLFRFMADPYVGAKYFLTDFFFVGARAGYRLGGDGKVDETVDEPLYNGTIRMNVAEQTASSAYMFTPSKIMIQLMCGLQF